VLWPVLAFPKLPLYQRRETMSRISISIYRNLVGLVVTAVATSSLANAGPFGLLGCCKCQKAVAASCAPAVNEASDACVATDAFVAVEGCGASTPSGIPAEALTYELNKIMTAQIQGLTAQVETLGLEAKAASDSKEEMAKQIAELTAEHDKALAANKELTESLELAKQATKKAEQSLVKAGEENKDLKQKLSAANNKAKKAAEQLVSAQSDKEKSDAEKKKIMDELAAMQTERSKKNEGSEKSDDKKDDKSSDKKDAAAL
jgi:hypothetical protein